MLGLPGILALLVYIYVRPHEFVPELANVPFLYIFLGLALFGILIDVYNGRTRIIPSPYRNWILVFYGWVLLTILLKRPDTLTSNGITITVSVTLFLVCAHGITSVRSFFTVVMTIFTVGFFVATVGTHQGFQPFMCIASDPMNPQAKLAPDGRPCAYEMDGVPVDAILTCIEGGAPGRRYGCEKVGVLGTTSVGGGRVRYLGVLEDPNELGLATSMAIPFAFAFFEQRKSLFRTLLLLLTLLNVGLTNFFTKSRGGQVVFSAVLGAYFIRRFGIRKGVIAAATLGLPLVAYGGREGAEAEESVLERLSAAAAGIKMMLSNPVYGVGYGQFNEHHYLTAHNAYVLAVGELGMVGMVLFCIVLYLSLKVPVMALRQEVYDHEGVVLQSIAMAMLATFVGASIGIFFLSWTYHFVLWIHFGLSGALYSVVKLKYPYEYEVRLSRREIALIFLGCVAILIGLFIQTKRKGVW